MLACAHPLRVHDGSETPSTISLKQVSTIAEMRSIKFTCKRSPEIFMSLADHAAHILHLHANGDKLTLDGQRRIALADLHEWVDAAVALAPDMHNAEIARTLINENLGPYAYDI